MHLFGAVMTAGLGLWLSQYAGSSTTSSIVAMTLATTGIVTALPIFWALPASRLSGRAAAGGLALINSIGNLGGFVGPYAMGVLSQVTGSTASAMGWLSCSLFLAAILTLRLP